MDAPDISASGYRIRQRCAANRRALATTHYTETQMKKLIALSILSCSAAPALAQETADTFRIREVIVSATRLPQSAHTVSTAVSVIHSGEFQRLGLRNAADVLRTVSGAALVQSGSYGSFTSMFLRGGESDYVQVLIDGVQINSPGEHFDYSGLSLE